MLERMERRGLAPGLVGLVLACAFWGTTGAAASFLPADVSRVAVGAATMGIGGALLLLVTLPGSARAWRDPSIRRWLLVGGLGVVVYPLAFYPAMQLAGVAVGNVVALGTGPVFAALLEWRLDRRRPGAVWGIATAAAVVGVVLLATARGGTGGAGDPGSALLGILLGLVAGFAYALYTYAAGRAMRTGRPSSAVMGAVFGAGAVPLLIVLACTAGPLFVTVPSAGITAYLAIGPTMLAYLLFGLGVRALPSSTVTVVTLLEPALTTVLAVLVVGERLAALAWVGLALILAAVLILSIASAIAGRRGVAGRAAPGAVPEAPE